MVPQEHRVVAEQLLGPRTSCLTRPLHVSAPERRDAHAVTKDAVP